MKRLRPAGGPRSRRTRSKLAMNATGWSRTDIQARILKGLYSPRGSTRSPAYELAWKHGWITLAAYLQAPFVPGRSALDAMYESNPLFAVFKMAQFKVKF